MKKLIQKRKKTLITTGLLMLIPSTFAFATEPTGLSLSFDVTEMFTWAQAILDAMMPVVYVSMGVGLGFLIVRALKSAFN